MLAKSVRDTTEAEVVFLLISQPSTVPDHYLEKIDFQPTGQDFTVVFLVITVILTYGTIFQSSDS